MSDHSPLPWVYRPNKYDDWGWIRGQPQDGEKWGDLAAVAKGGDETPFDEHRRNGTDPYAANAAFIVKAVNSHEALVDMLEQAREYIASQAEDFRPAARLTEKIDAVLAHLSHDQQPAEKCRT